MNSVTGSVAVFSIAATIAVIAIAVWIYKKGYENGSFEAWFVNDRAIWEDGYEAGKSEVLEEIKNMQVEAEFAEDLDQELSELLAEEKLPDWMRSQQEVGGL